VRVLAFAIPPLRFHWREIAEAEAFDATGAKVRLHGVDRPISLRLLTDRDHLLDELAGHGVEVRKPG
jgi:hypothetical protein